MPFKHKQKRGFTDRLYLFNLRFVVSLTIVAILLIIASAFLPQMDLSPLPYIVPPAWTELAIHTGFIIWKAKAENMRKYPRAMTQVQAVENEIFQTQYYEGENQNG